MAGPWEKYQQQAQTEEGPWSKYAAAQNQETEQSQAAPAQMPNAGEFFQYFNKRFEPEQNWGIVRDIAQGAAQSIPNAMQEVSKKIGGALPKGARFNPFIPNQNYQQANVEETFAPIGSGKQNLGSQLARGIGESLPYIAAGGTSILGQVLSGMAHGGVTGKEGQENLFGLLPQGKTGAIIEGALAGLIPGGGKLLEKARPSNVLRGTLSDAQLAKNLEQTAGTNTGLGQVIENPLMQEVLENVAPKLPFSGAGKIAQETGNQVRQQGESFLGKMLGENSAVDVGGQLQTELKAAKEVARNEKNRLYNQRNKLADEVGATVEHSSLADEAAKKLNKIEESPKLAAEAPTELIDKLKLYSDPFSKDSFANSDLIRARLGEKVKEFSQAGKDYEAGIYRDLKTALEKDMNAAAYKSKDARIIDTTKKAREFYQKEYAPFKDKEVARFIEGGGDPDLLVQSFLRTGKNTDRERLLNKLMTKLPENKQGLVPYSYFSGAVDKEGIFDPLKFASRQAALGKRQETALLRTPEARKEANRIASLAAKNKEGLMPMFNPKTGARNAIYNAAKIGGLAGLGMGGAPGAVLGALLTPLAAGAASRPLVKALTSEKVRERLVNQMLKNERKFGKPQNIMAGQTLGQALAQTQGAQ